MRIPIPKTEHRAEEEEQESSHSAENKLITAYYKTEKKEKQGVKVDALRKIDGDPFDGFSYLGGPSMLAQTSGAFPAFSGGTNK